MLSEQTQKRFRRVQEIFYLFLISGSFYLLYLSQTGEANTVWQVLNPAFLPVLFIATVILIFVLSTGEKASIKLLFTIFYSILVHSLFSVIFPAGDLSGQQIIMGRVRLVYDNVILHGWPLWSTNVPLPSIIFEWLKGTNFQIALTVTLARMLSLDILKVHLFLVPVLWGIFTPIAAYLVTHTLTENDKISVLSALFFSAFPYATYFGAISVPSSLGFLFFFFSLYFMLKSLKSNDSKTTILMIGFSFFSLLAHYLAGVMAFSFLILVAAFKLYEREKTATPLPAKVTLLVSFTISIMILPVSLIYLRLFQSATFTAFTLNKLFELPLQEIVGLLLVGELAYSSSIEITFLMVIGPVIALLSMVYFIYDLRKNHPRRNRIHVYFLFTIFLVVLIDYRILKLFMTGLPLNEERLWVFRDFIAVPFVAIGILAAVSWLKRMFDRFQPVTDAGLKSLFRANAIRALGVLLVLNVFIPVVLGAWVTSSLSAAYPQVAPLQTTWYELKAAEFIDSSTHERYVVIGDVWTVFAGEVIVGINNPQAYYFREDSRIGHDYFENMSRDPSPTWMLSAMNYTGTTVSFFVVTEPRMPVGEFAQVVSLAMENGQLTVVNIPDVPSQKLCVFSYRKF